MAPFKSTLARSVGKLLGVYKETDISLRGDLQSTRFVQTVATPFTANIVMMGGGGGGGAYQGGGGGGAGGMAIFTFAVTIGSPYPFQVGNSGLGSPAYPVMVMVEYIHTSIPIAVKKQVLVVLVAPALHLLLQQLLDLHSVEVVAVVDQILMLLLMAHLVSVQVQTLMYLVETVVVILAPQVSHKVTPVVAVVV